MARRFKIERLEHLMKNHRPAVGPVELAQGAGVSRETVRLWLARQATPSLENLEAVAAFFGVQLDYFMDDDEEPQKAGRK